jgi:polar amino acid transport system substrate-binding protein
MDRRVMLTALGGLGAGAVTLTAGPTPQAAAQAAPQSGLKRILDRGKLIVGTRSTTIGFGFKDAKGELVGFDVEIARQHARKLVPEPAVRVTAQVQRLPRKIRDFLNILHFEDIVKNLWKN